MGYEYTKRARIFVGTVCNTRCRFCYYYLTGLKNKRPIENIKKQLDIAKKAGMEAVDFSGGEPTIIPEIFELVKYAKNKGFKIIGIVTNGLRMADKKFVEDIINTGLNDILFSVHGNSKEEHNWLTQVDGSFEKLMLAIKNVQDIGIPFRINTTVTKVNYKSLTEHAKLFVKLKPIQTNFILFNDWETADKISEHFCIKYSDASPYIKKAIDIMKEKIKYINVRYIPFCFMKGYEEHVCDYPQKIYDPFEWSQRILAKLDSKGIIHPLKYYSYLLYGFTKFHPPLKSNLIELAEDTAVAMRRGTYTKPEKCKKCKYYELCDGLEPSYVKINGIDELKPEIGEKIHDPLYFRKNFYKGIIS